MKTIWDVQVRVAKGIIIFNSIVILVGVIFLKDWKPLVIGSIFGSIIAIANFSLLAISTERSLTGGFNKRGAAKYATHRAIIRLFIVWITLYISLTSDHINTVGTVIALLSIKPVILIQNFLYK